MFLPFQIVDCKRLAKGIERGPEPDSVFLARPPGINCLQRQHPIGIAPKHIDTC